MDNIKHEHICHCGGVTNKHNIGDKGCFRFMTEPPDFKITSEYIYINQRGYYQHPCGCWSRWEGSYNSIDCD